MNLDPKNLPNDILAQALFENAILHGQKFAKQLEIDPGFPIESRTVLASEIIEYAIAIMIFYFHAAKRLDLNEQVLSWHEKFVRQNCGTGDPHLQAEMLNFWREGVRRKVWMIELGNDIRNPGNCTFERNIMTDQGFKIDPVKKHQLRPQIEQFVREVHESMHHFGIAAAARNPDDEDLQAQLKRLRAENDSLIAAGIPEGRGISRDAALHIARVAAEKKKMTVIKVTSLEEIQAQGWEPGIIACQPAFRDCWIAYLDQNDGFSGMRESYIMLISKSTGELKYEGGASDEG